jgi:hypothetical protein
VSPLLDDRAVEDVIRADLIDLLDTAKAEGKLRTPNVLLSNPKQMFRSDLMRKVGGTQSSATGC